MFQPSLIFLAGVPQKFTGFTSKSQFWRMNIKSNHGGQCTCFQAVEFNGTDHRIIELFEQLNLQKYSDSVIKSVSILSPMNNNVMNTPPPSITYPKPQS